MPDNNEIGRHIGVSGGIKLNIPKIPEAIPREHDTR